MSEDVKYEIWADYQDAVVDGVVVSRPRRRLVVTADRGQLEPTLGWLFAAEEKRAAAAAATTDVGSFHVPTFSVWQVQTVTTKIEVPALADESSATHRVSVTDLATGRTVYSVDHTVRDTPGMNVDEGRVAGRVADHEVALLFASPDVCPFDCDYCRS